MPQSAAAQRASIPGQGKSLRDRLLKRGRSPSIERIYRDHHQEIYRYCLAIVRNKDDAEDALQNTMAAAARSLPGEERDIAIRPWLFRVAHNESISIIRSRREAPSELEPDETTLSAADELEGRERLRTLISDLQTLPERQRAALVMRELSGLSYAEIAAALGSAEGAARQIVYEARTALVTREEGRAMDCEEARLAIDSGDRRKLRGRKLKAHMSACESCADFRAAIDARRDDFQALCPPLPIAAAGGILAAVTGGASGVGAAAGGGAAATGAGGAILAGGVASSAAVKGASVAAAVVIAAGAADATGVVELPGPLHIGGEKSQTTTPGATGDTETGTAGESTGASGKPGSEQAQGARDQGEKASAKKGANGKGGKKGKGKNGVKNEGGAGNGKGNAGGNPAAPGGGKGQSPPQAGGTSGSAGTPQGSPPSNSNAGGNGGGSPQGGSGSGGASQGGGPPANSNAGGNAGGPTAPGKPATPGKGPG